MSDDDLPGRPSLTSLAVDTLPINLAILDGEGTIVHTNRAWWEFGEANDIALRPYSLGVNYLGVTDAADDEHAGQVAVGLRELPAGERERLEVEYPCHSPDEQRWVRMRAAPFTIDGEGYVAVAHVDVTARVRSERELAIFEQAVETAGRAIFIVDHDGTITYVNPAFTQITGYEPEEAIGRTPRILKSHEMDEGFYRNHWETIRSGAVWEGTIVNRRKSGELYYAHETITPVVDDDGDLLEFVAVQTDVTALREQRVHMEKLGTVLRHEMRNQFNVLQG